MTAPKNQPVETDNGPSFPNVRATYTYFTEMPNLLFTAGTVCFLGKHLVSLLGKNHENFPGLEKIASTADNCLIAYQFSSLVSSAYSLNSDLRLKNRSYGLTCKGTASLFKTVSAVLLVYKSFKEFGIFGDKSVSATVTIAGSGLGVLSSAIAIIDTGDRSEGGKGEIQEPLHEENPAENEDSRKKRTEIFLERVSKVIDIAIGITAMSLAYHTVSGTGFTTGKFSRIISLHSANILGSLYTALNVIGFVQHVRKPVKRKQPEREGYGLLAGMLAIQKKLFNKLDYIFTKLPETSEWFGLISGSVDALDEFDISTLFGVKTRPLGDLAKVTVSTFCVKRTIESIGNIVSSVQKFYNEATKENFFDTFNGTVRLTANTLRTFNWFGKYGEVTILSRHTEFFGFVAKVCSLYTATINTITHIRAISAAYGERSKSDAKEEMAHKDIVMEKVSKVKASVKGEVLRRAGLVYISASAVWLNGTGLLSPYIVGMENTLVGKVLARPAPLTATSVNILGNLVMISINFAKA